MCHTSAYLIIIQEDLVLSIDSEIEIIKKRQKIITNALTATGFAAKSESL